MPVAKSKPLKLQSVDQGDLKRLSSTEENYLSYLVGLHLIEDDSDTGNITLVSSGNNSIGSFTDTFFNQPDGTHPASSITSGTTTTELYQVAGPADETDSDVRRPVGYYNPPVDGSESIGSEGIYEMADSDFNILVERINGRIAQSDYLGQFYLGSSPPSGDYNVFINNVFSDTINDSTVTNYNIYRRESQSAPDDILDSDLNPTSIVSVKRSNGDSGDYEGLEPMTERQVKVSLGQRAKTLRAAPDGIGSYQLRSSSQGAPQSGLWRTVGTATNTKKETAEISYTRNRVSTYTRQRSSSFLRNVTEVQDFAGNFIGNYTTNFVGNFVGNYNRDFVGNYTGDYTRDFAGAYTGNYSRTFIGNYTGDFTGDFTGEYTRTSTNTQTFSRVATRTSTGGFIGDFTGQRTINYVGNSSQTFTDSFTGNYSRTNTFTGNFGGTFTRTSTRDSTRFVNEGPLYVAGNTFWQEEPAFSGFVTLTVEWNGQFIFGGTVPDTKTSVGPSESTDGLTYFKGSPQGAEFSVSRSGTLSFTGEFTGNYARSSTRTSAVTQNFTRTRTTSSTANFAGDFIGNFTGNFTRTRFVNYTGNFIGNYSRSVTFTGNYSRERQTDFTRNFTRNRSSSYSRVSTRVSVLNFTRNSTRTRVSSFTRDRTENFLGNFTRDSTRTSSRLSTFTGNYSRDITDTFSRTLIDSFVGTTIQPTTGVIETYTLYVRYA